MSRVLCKPPVPIPLCRFARSGPDHGMDAGTSCRRPSVSPSAPDHSAARKRASKLLQCSATRNPQTLTAPSLYFAGARHVLSAPAISPCSLSRL
jgi:hypothetical protein